jgi:hypothetical protein
LHLSNLPSPIRNRIQDMEPPEKENNCGELSPQVTSGKPVPDVLTESAAARSALKFLSLPPTPRMAAAPYREVTQSHHQTPNMNVVHRHLVQLTSSPKPLSSARTSRHRRSVASELSSASSSFKDDLGPPHHLLHDPVLCSPALAQWLEHPSSIPSDGECWSEGDSFASATNEEAAAATAAAAAAEFCWSIDQLAHFYPADIDEQALTNIDPDRHVAAWTPRRRRQWQRRTALLEQHIDRFFDPANRIAPSPWPAAGSRARPACGGGVHVEGFLRLDEEGAAHTLEPNIASPSCLRPPTRRPVSADTHCGDTPVDSTSSLDLEGSFTRAVLQAGEGESDDTPLPPCEPSPCMSSIRRTQLDFDRLNLSSPLFDGSRAGDLCGSLIDEPNQSSELAGPLLRGAQAGPGWQPMWDEETMHTLDACNATAIREGFSSGSSGFATLTDLSGPASNPNMTLASETEHDVNDKGLEKMSSGLGCERRTLRRRLFAKPDVLVADCDTLQAGPRALGPHMLSASWQPTRAKGTADVHSGEPTMHARLPPPFLSPIFKQAAMTAPALKTLATASYFGKSFASDSDDDDLMGTHFV